MEILKVWRDDSVNTCIACKICQAFAPQVFKVLDKMIVMPGIDFSLYSKEIDEAMESCPTQIIKIKYTMKVAVWDTYVVRTNGKIMNFDIIVPEKLKDPKTIFSFGQEYLKRKDIVSCSLSSNECQFCHIGEATEEMIKDINSMGYYIAEIENCN